MEELIQVPLSWVPVALQRTGTEVPKIEPPTLESQQRTKIMRCALGKGLTPGGSVSSDENSGIQQEAQRRRNGPFRREHNVSKSDGGDCRYYRPTYLDQCKQRCDFFWVPISEASETRNWISSFVQN